MIKKDRIRLILASILFVLSLIFAGLLILTAIKFNGPKVGKDAIMVATTLFSSIFLVISMVMYFITWDELDVWDR